MVGKYVTNVERSIKMEIKCIYKKYLADILYQDALRTSKAELQEVSFFQE